MASNNVNLGIGLATGMFFTAPAGTALPTSPLDTLAADWTEAGVITADGADWDTGKDSDALRNWAKEVERLVSSDEGGTVQTSIMETTKRALETIFGTGNVTYSAADQTHGNITSVTVAPGVSAPPMAFLFLMKDGDDAMLLGTSKGIVRDLDTVGFKPTDAIEWGITIEAASWTFTKDDGQTL